MGEITLQLNSPLTDEQWDTITDVDFDHTDRITFHTKHGKEVEFVKSKPIKTNADKNAGPKWISVEERLPDVNERVLACVSVFGEPSVWDAVRWNGKEWEAEKEAAYEYWTSIDFPVTHWMPLPEPPKEDDNG